mgnify:CR=1 FL=1
MMAVNIANGLAEKGVASHLCATRLEGDLKAKIDNNVGYLFLNKKRKIDIKATIKLYTYIKHHNISIIHAHSTSYFMGFLIKLINPTLKLIWHDHYGNSEALKDRKVVFLRIISKSFSASISVNNLLLNWTKNKLKVRNFSYIPNFASFNTNEIAQTFLKGLENKRIICLANLRPQKNHINLLKAFTIINKSNPEWTLHLVGLDMNDSYANEVNIFIKNHALSNQVYFYGSCPDTSHILEQASIGVLASKSEGLPVTLLEYGLAKLPVVVTNVGECSSVVSNNLSGIVVPSNNPNELANKIIELIENKAKRKKFGDRLFKKVNLNYSKENFMNQLISIYNLE